MEFYADRRQISLLVFLLVLLLCQVKNVIMPDADRRQMQVVTVKVWQSCVILHGHPSCTYESRILHL